MASTYDEIMAKSRELYSTGDIDGARRLAEIALSRRDKADAPKSFGRTLKENLLGDDDPTTQNFGETVGSLLNKAGESLTFGLVGDEASAAVESLLPGVDYETRRDHYRQQEEVLERENPGLALAADIGGALAAPLGTLGAVGKGAKLATKMAASGGATGLLSALYGFAEGEDSIQDRARDAVKDGGAGFFIGSAIPVAGAGVQKVADARVLKRAAQRALDTAPTTDDLRKAGQEAYAAIDNAGVSIKPDKVQEGLLGIQSGLRAEGAGFVGADKVLPASRAIMEAAEDVGAGANSVPFKELDVFRRYMGNAAAANLANKADTRNATNALTQIDDLIQKLGPDDVDAGDVETLKALLPKARDLWSKMSRSQMIDDAIDAAQNYRSGEASGIKNQFARILNNKKLARGFSEAEKKMMRRVINGNLPEQLLGYLGSGLGMVAQMAGMGAVKGLPGAAVGAGTAMGSRKLSEQIVHRNAEIVRAFIAGGGMKELPKSEDGLRKLIEQLLRQGTAASIQ